MHFPKLNQGHLQLSIYHLFLGFFLAHLMTPIWAYSGGGHSKQSVEPKKDQKGKSRDLQQKNETKPKSILKKEKKSAEKKDKGHIQIQAPAPASEHVNRTQRNTFAASHRNGGLDKNVLPSLRKYWAARDEAFEEPQEEPINLTEIVETEDISSVINYLELFGKNNIDSFPEDYYFNPILMATYKGNLAILKLLLQAGANYNIEAKEGKSTALELAIGAASDPEDGNTAERLKLVEELLPLKLKVLENNLPRLRGTYLSLISIGKPELLQIFFETYGNEVLNSQETKFDNSGLVFAAQKGHVEIVKVLLQAGADIQIGNNLGETAFEGSTPPEVMEVLCDHATRVAKMSSTQIANLFIALVKSSKPENILIFTKYFGNRYLNSRDFKSGFTPLMLASQMGDLQKVKLLLELGANLTSRSIKEENTALQIAFKAEQNEIVQFLSMYEAEPRNQEMPRKDPSPRLLVSEAPRTETDMQVDKQEAIKPLE